jgi:hypothetical protein
MLARLDNPTTAPGKAQTPASHVTRLSQTRKSLIFKAFYLPKL